MKILIKACTNGNYGDDLFVLSLLERYANCHNECIVLAYQPKKYRFLSDKYDNVIIKPYPVPTLLNREIGKALQSVFIKKRNYKKAYGQLINEQYDVFINVGGSLFAQFEDEKFVLSNWIEDFLVTNINAKKKYLLNINILSDANEKFYNECRDIISLYDDVCFRDKLSYSLFSDMNNCRFAPDMAFSLFSIFQNFRNKNDSKCDILGINLIDFKENKRMLKSRCEYIQNYEQTVLNIAKEYLEKGYIIRLFTFDDREEEKEYIKSIKDKINRLNQTFGEKIQIYEYKFLNIFEFIKCYCECSKVLTTRFHAMITALLADIDFYPIVYDKKISNFLDSIGYSGCFSLLESMVDTTQILDDLDEKHNFNRSMIEKRNAVFSESDKFILK